MTSRILVALDVASAHEAVRLAKRLHPHVGGFKVGLELVMGPGAPTIGVIAELGRPVFADVKLHDIPTTVERAARQLARLGARWVTAHAGGGRPMLEAAVSGLAAGAGADPAGILAVTVMTSLDDAVLASVGVTGTAGRHTSRLSKLAHEAGAEGVICSVQQLGVVAEVAPTLLRVTPGIRPSGEDVHDQRQTATPSEAASRGADWLVVGRPITRNHDPVAMAEAINDEVERATAEAKAGPAPR